MSDVAIRAEALGKRYVIAPRARDTMLRERLVGLGHSSLRRLLRRARRPRPNIWALRDVSFEVRHGEVLGVIGANGAGKTTLLKVLSRITEPTHGIVNLMGRVGALLEVGTGFHPELSGRENIFLNGAILGMRRAEIRSRFDEIVAFAGVGEFLDTPVKRYSSGMYMRLAFAVAAHLQTEILLVDEVLAVGDAVFQLQCLNKMQEASKAGRTVLFVSHNMEAVAALCERAMVLAKGTVVRTGTPRECIDFYLGEARRETQLAGAAMSLREHTGRTKQLQGPVRLTRLLVADDGGRAAWTVRCGRHFDAILEYEVTDRRRHDVMFAVALSNVQGQRITSCRSQDSATHGLAVAKDGRVRCRLPRLPLVPGLYRLTLSVATAAGPSDVVYDAAVIEVVGADFYPTSSLPVAAHGPVLFDHEWTILPEEA